MRFQVSEILGLCRKRGGDHRGLEEELQRVGEVDTVDHSEILARYGIDPRRLENGDYDEEIKENR